MVSRKKWVLIMMVESAAGLAITPVLFWSEESANKVAAAVKAATKGSTVVTIVAPNAA